MVKEKLVPVYDYHKSYYGKAVVLKQDNGDLWLKSYNTVVIKIVNGQPVRIWTDYSDTTMRHVREFMRQFYYADYNYPKKWWNELPIDIYGEEE